MEKFYELNLELFAHVIPKVKIIKFPFFLRLNVSSIIAVIDKYE
jgi:hypothetical protein